MLHVVLRALCEVMAETVEPNHVSIRWAKEHGMLNMAEIDPRLLDEVTNRPNLPDAVKARVKVLLLEMAKRIQADDDDDE